MATASHSASPWLPSMAFPLSKWPSHARHLYVESMTDFGREVGQGAFCVVFEVPWYSSFRPPQKPLPDHQVWSLNCPQKLHERAAYSDLQSISTRVGDSQYVEVFNPFSCCTLIYQTSSHCANTRRGWFTFFLYLVGVFSPKDLTGFDKETSRSCFRGIGVKADPPNLFRHLLYSLAEYLSSRC